MTDPTLSDVMSALSRIEANQAIDHAALLSLSSRVTLLESDRPHPLATQPHPLASLLTRQNALLLAIFFSTVISTVQASLHR